MSPDGNITSLEYCHKELNTYFNNNEIELCGAIDSHMAIAVSQLNSAEQVNVFSVKFTEYFNKHIRGVILLVGSDSNGEACDLEIDIIQSKLSLNQP